MTNEQLRQQAWDMYAAAALRIEIGLGTDLRFSADYADALLKERDLRFPPDEKEV